MVAWVMKEEQGGAVFVLDVVRSDGADAYPVGTTLRRKVTALRRQCSTAGASGGKNPSFGNGVLSRRRKCVVAGGLTSG